MPKLIRSISLKSRKKSERFSDYNNILPRMKVAQKNKNYRSISEFRAFSLFSSADLTERKLKNWNQTSVDVVVGNKNFGELR